MGTFNLKSPNASYQVYHGEPNPSPEAKLSTAKDENDYYIKFTNPWRIEIIVPLSIAVIVVVFIIIIFLGIRKKEEKN